MAILMAAIASHERPRERLLARGIEALTDRELLALILRNGTNGCSALDMAGALLTEYGSLAALAAVSPRELAMCPGIGPAKAAALVAAFTLGRRLHSSVDVRPVLRTAEDVAKIAAQQLDGVRRERVLVLICDAGNRLRSTVSVSEGSIDRSLVPIREILNAVLIHDGRAFALAHNHPGGTVDPSDADQRATDDLKEAAGVVGLRFLGHVVVAGADWRVVK